MAAMTETAGTAVETEEAQTPEATGTPPAPDEVTTLRSRNAGLDAKVTELSKAQASLQAERDALAAQLAEAQKGVVDKDEALRAQVAAKDAELALARKEAAIARISAKYPETFGVLGEAAAALTEDQLAASEARFAGVPAPQETPRPVGANPPRQVGATKRIEDMTAAELRKHLATFPPSVWSPND